MAVIESEEDEVICVVLRISLSSSLQSLPCRQM